MTEDNKSIIDLIKTNLEVLGGVVPADGKLPDYAFIPRPPSTILIAPPNNDLEMFDFINRLLTCNDDKGNYYALGDINILESYLTKPEILAFVKDISNNGYLFNDMQVSLNTKYFSNIFTKEEKLQHKDYTGGTDVPDKQLRCPFHHIFGEN